MNFIPSKLVLEKKGIKSIDKIGEAMGRSTITVTKNNYIGDINNDDI
jgi:hypothetical protein